MLYFIYNLILLLILNFLNLQRNSMNIILVMVTYSVIYTINRLRGPYMRKKDILELKKRFKKDHCTFTKMCGCYVNGEKNILLKFRETFLNLEEDD